MPELPPVQPNTVIDSSTFGNPVLERVVNRYADQTERDAKDPLPDEGQVAFIQDEGHVQYYQDVFYSEWMPLVPLVVWRNVATSVTLTAGGNSDQNILSVNVPAGMYKPGMWELMANFNTDQSTGTTAITYTAKLKTNGTERKRLLIGGLDGAPKLPVLMRTRVYEAGAVGQVGLALTVARSNTAGTQLLQNIEIWAAYLGNANFRAGAP